MHRAKGQATSSNQVPNDFTEFYSSSEGVIVKHIRCPEKVVILTLMKCVAAAALLTFVIPSVHAQRVCKKETVEQLVKELADAYEARNLGAMDTKRPYSGTVKIVIEHSLGEGRDRFESKSFKRLGQAEQWLRKREIEGMPGREVRPLQGCKRGVCTYNFEGGIVHRVLYLEKISYGCRNGRSYVRTIFLLDGD